MPIKVRIPTPLRKLTEEKDVVELNGTSSIGDLIESLEKDYPGIKERLVDEKGEVRRFINVFINDEDIRFLENKKSPLKDGDEVSIVPAIAGG